MVAPQKYPEPYSTKMLNVGGGHTIYIEQSGNPEGIPLLRLHGGPGESSKPKHRAQVDLTKYRLIMFDQRGCGNSKPFGSILNNTTQDLLADIEKIRAELGIEEWVVMGSSWGSTLALLYAQAYPAQVMSLIVSAIFFGRNDDAAWIYSPEGVASFFPEAYLTYLQALGLDDEADLQHTQQQRILAGDIAASKARTAYLGTFFDMAYNITPWETLPADEQATLDNHILACQQIEMHYEKNHFFITDNQILDNMHKISHIPGYIFHGRYDMLCPPASAYVLHHAWPGSQLTILLDAGHSSDTLKNAKASLINALSFNK